MAIHLGHFPSDMYECDASGLNSLQSVEMPLEDAMRLYWKAKNVQVKLDATQYNGIAEWSPPDPIVIQDLNWSIDENKSVYGASSFSDRVCFYGTMDISGINTSWDYSIKLFTDTAPDNATYPRLNKNGNTAKIHIAMEAHTLGYYSAVTVKNIDYGFWNDTTLDIIVFGNTYTANAKIFGTFSQSISFTGSLTFT